VFIEESGRTVKTTKIYRKAAVVVQSTQNLKEVLEIVQMLRGCVQRYNFTQPLYASPRR
jgi:hypothetical protein